MALTNFNFLEIAPSEYVNSATTSSFQCDAADEKVAFIFRVRKSGTINTLSIPIRNVTVSDTLRVSLQTVDGSGDPSGVLYGGSAAATFTPVGTSQNIVTLSTPATATAGDIVAVVTEFNSYVAGNINISYFNAGCTFPYVEHLTGGSWSKAVCACGHGIGYSDGTWENIGAYPGLGTTGANVSTFNSGSNPNERALHFKLPFTATLHGCEIVNTSTAGGNFDIILYDYDGVTILTSLSVVANKMATTSRDIAVFLFPTSVRLSRNRFYRLSVKPTTANDITIYELAFPATHLASMDSVAGGQNFQRSTRTSGGAWTNSTSTRPRYGLILTQIDDGAGTPHTAFNALD